MTTSQETHCHLFVFFLSVEDDDGPRGSSSFFGFFSCAENDDEPPSSTLSFNYFHQMYKMMSNWEAFGSLSSFGFFLRCKRRLLVVFPQMQMMMMSWEAFDLSSSF